MPSLKAFAYKYKLESVRQHSSLICIQKYILVFFLVLSEDLLAQQPNEVSTAAALQKQIEQAVTKAEKLPLLLSLAISYETSDPAMLGRYADEAILLAAQLEDDKSLAAGYSAKARSYSYLGEFEPAIECYILALKSAIVSNDKDILYNIRGSLGNTYYQMELYSTAKEHYEYAYKIAESSDVTKRDRRLGAISLNLGNIYLELDDYDHAETNYTHALSLFKGIDYETGIVDALLNMAVLHSERNSDWDKALPLLEEGLKVHEKIQYPRNLAHILNSFAGYHLDKKQYDEAIKVTKRMIALSREIDAKHLVALGEKTLSVIYEKKGDYESALAMKSSHESAKTTMLGESTFSKVIELESELENHEQSKIISRLASNANRQKVILLISFAAVLTLILITGRIYRQKRKLNYRILSADEENKILKQSNASLKNRLLQLAEKIEQARSEANSERSSKYAKSAFRQEDKDRYIHQLLDVMETQRLYTNAELSLGKLAKTLSLSSHQLSELLNESIGKSFHDFVNMYRVEEAKGLMSTPEACESKILDIAFAAGFSSKASFNRIFKNVTGTTPSAYRKAFSQSSVE